MKTSKKVVAALAAVAVFGGMSVGAPIQAQAAPNWQAHGWHHRNPEMHRALKNLQRARDYLESARHDFGGHRQTAQNITNQAIDQVKDGLEFTHDHVYVKPADHTGRDPLLKDALTKLQAARGDLSNAKHDYDGHRQKALDLTNNAITEVNRALSEHHHH
ncbi:MAG: hypothetical protein ABI210_06150 [Abditibacteriaceae bacterium]